MLTPIRTFLEQLAAADQETAKTSANAARVFQHEPRADIFAIHHQRQAANFYRLARCLLGVESS